MKPYEFTRFYHQRMGRFVCKHKGNGVIVDNIFKPMRSMPSSVGKTVVKPFAKKALKSSISHTGDKLGKTGLAERIFKWGGGGLMRTR